MATELQQVRADIAEVRGDIADLAVQIAGWAAHQQDHARRIGKLETNCAESQKRRAALEATGSHQAAELDRLRGGAAHWGRWVVAALWGVLVAVVTAVVSRSL